MNTKSNSSKPLILIVDDDLFTQMQLRIYLQREGYEVVVANNGLEGLANYVEYHPDLILLDAMMPVMNGFECCSQLVALPQTVHTPILMITGLDDQESVDNAFDAGATDYITKPIHWAVLRQRVKRLIQQVTLQKQLEEANKLLKHLVSLDGLTQISNRRRFDEYINEQWQKMTRENLPLSLILCDVDFFKFYNDTYGHQSGDDCLKKVVNAISNVITSPTDLVARYGGEEFAIILPNIKNQDAVYLAEKIRLNVKNLKIPHTASLVSEWVSVSLGIACLIPHSDSSPKILFEAADKALYRAKSFGRDRFEIASF